MHLRKAVLLASALMFPFAALAQEYTLWHIGTFDRSSSEFRNHTDVDYTNPNSDLTFTVGQNKDADWYRFQPGPANGIAGGRVHPFTLKFSLPDEPHGVYKLKIAILYETPRLSFLHLDVNGHGGDFFFHPKLDFNAGDWEGTFVPQTSTDEKTISIPAAWLHRGENQIVFTAMDDPASPQNCLGAIAPGHTGLVYDALEFSNDSSATYDPAHIGALVEPTIFYRKATNRSFEVVDVVVNAPQLAPSGSVELKLAGKSLQQSYSTKNYSTKNEFGELRISFDVPEWQGSTPASVRLNGSFAAPQDVSPAKKWTVAIIPHEHLDIGFTDYPAKVAELHAQSIDVAMGLIAKTPDFRWTLDGSWVANQYLNTRSKPLADNFLNQVRRGNIVIPPEFANEHTGNASWESLARSFYNQHQLAREYKLPSADAAQIVDVPSYTWAYASVLHDAGVKYFVAASNSWRAPIMLHGRWNEKSPFWWEGPDGGRVLMWYSRAYLQAHTLFGGPWRIESVRDSLPVFLQAYTRPDYPANTAIIFGTQLENTPLAKEQSEIAGDFNRQYEWPHLEFSTVHNAMQKIESEWKGDIPVYRGDFGPYWEDGYGSDAAHTALHRENQHRMATAEIMGSAVHALDPNVHPDVNMLADAWRNELTYDEHTWTYVSATTQPEHHQSEDQIALKGSRTERARNDINESIQREWAQLEALLKPKEASVAVFNSLNWPRTGWIETDLPEGSSLFDPSTKTELSCEVLFKGKGIVLPGFGPANIRVRCLTTEIPAIGYKLYAVRPAQPKSNEPLQGSVLENQFYRVTLDPEHGAIRQIFDKQLNRDLVDSSGPYGFGQYLYVTGGDDYPNNSLYRFGVALKPPQLTVHGAQSGKLVSAEHTPAGIVVKLASTAPNTPNVQTEILLPDQQKQIYFTYHVHKQRVINRESAYIAFAFAVADPQFTYGSQTAWVNPAKDELPGGSREWYLPTTWATVSNPQLAAAVVPLDAPLVTFGDIVRATWPTEFHPKSSTVFSWLMDNYWGTNFPAWQGGEFTFRYVLTSAPQLDAPALTRSALNALTPLERDDIPAALDASPLPTDNAALLDIDAPNVTLLAWKQAEDGDGSILRLQESAGKAGPVSIHSQFLKFDRAWLCDLLEENRTPLSIESGTLKTSIKPFQVLTIRIRTAPKKP